MATVDMPRLPLDKAIWGTCNPCPMATLDPYNYPIVAATPADWYRPVTFVSGCENPANAASGSSSNGGGSFLYDPREDAWMDIPHFLGMDPDYSTAGVFSHGAATFHPTGPSGTATAGSASGITIDKALSGEVAVGATIRITGGTGSGQSRTITGVSNTTSTGYLSTLGSGGSSGSILAGTTSNIGTPSGVVAGDLMIVVFYLNQTIPQITPPAGWTQMCYVNDGFWGVWGWYKQAGSSEPANYAWTVASGFNVNYRTWSVNSSDFVSCNIRYTGAIYDSNQWAPNVPTIDHRVTRNVMVYDRNNVTSGVTVNGLDASLFLSVYDLSPLGELPSVYRNAPVVTLQTPDSQIGWVQVITKSTGSYTESTTLTVDSPWSVQPDATSTYEIDSGSFWVWRGNASDSTWRWAKFDIATGTWTKKTSTDAVATPTYVNSTVVDDYTYGPTQAMNIPAGVANGDLLIGIVVCGQNGATVPSGWTPLADVGGGGGSIPRMVAFYRIANSEPVSYTVTRDGASNFASTYCVAYRNAGVPTYLNSYAQGSFSASTTLTCPNIMQTPSRVLSLGFVSGSSFNTGQALPLCSTDTLLLNGAFSRLGDRATTQATASSELTYTWTYSPDGTTGMANMIADALFLVPGTAPGMSNYGKADPSRQGGIHAATDSSDTIWLGGDAQTSLRKYVISTDSWSALTAHEPYTRPMRNVGGGMAYQTVDGSPYLFYWCPIDDFLGLSGLTAVQYDYPYGRFYAYDLTNDVWLDLFTVTPGNSAQQAWVTAPTKYSRVVSYNGRLIWAPGVRWLNQTSTVYATENPAIVVVQDPTKVDVYNPAKLQGPRRPHAVSGPNATASIFSNYPTVAKPIGGTPFVVSDSSTNTKWLYLMEHTNAQAITPLRCNITGRSWA